MPVSPILLTLASGLAAHAPILHYLRSNRDGTEPENVVQFQPDAHSIAVYKWIDKCTRAAYVTATLDSRRAEVTAYVAGKVARDGSQSRFGTLTLAPQSNRLLVDITPPGGPRLQQAHALKSRAYILYDFDFADLNAMLQAKRPGTRFAYDLPVIWPAADGLFRDYGRLVGTFSRNETHLGRRTRRFELRVDGPSRSRGTLWLDRTHGFIIDALLPLPNHDNYRDFRLKLVKVERGGQAAWNAMLAGHYANCPTGN